MVHSGTAFAGHYYSYIQVHACRRSHLVIVHGLVHPRTACNLQLPPRLPSAAHGLSSRRAESCRLQNPACADASWHVPLLEQERHTAFLLSGFMGPSTPLTSCNFVQERGGGGGTMGEWYCFDDNQVELWDINSLERDCFGGKYTPANGLPGMKQQVRGALQIWWNLGRLLRHACPGMKQQVRLCPEACMCFFISEFISSDAIISACCPSPYSIPVACRASQGSVSENFHMLGHAVVFCTTTYITQHPADPTFR